MKEHDLHFLKKWMCHNLLRRLFSVLVTIYEYIPLGEDELVGYHRCPSGIWKGTHKHNLVLT